MKKTELTGILSRITPERCAELLSDMVKIGSVNPFDAEDEGEVALGRHLSKTLKNWGLKVEEQTASNDRFNVVAFLEGKEDGPTLILNSHMDTVGVEGMKDPFNPKISDGKLYGRGSCDAKGSIASMLIALEALMKARVKLVGRVMLAAVCDEEYKSVGTNRLVGKYKADFAVVGEPTELRVGTAHKGFVWIKLTVRGKAAHGSVPEQGIDAIEKTADLITMFKGLRQEYTRKPLHPLLGEPKLHMGTIMGGTAPSVVPDMCELVLERRTLPGETKESVLKEVQGLIYEAMKNDESLSVEISTPFQRTPFEVDSDDPFIKRFADVFEEVSGRKAVICGLPYWTDAAIISDRLRIPTCVFGPGDIRYAHSHGEHIKISELVDAAKVYAALIASVCS